MAEAPEVPLSERIETFQSSFELDLQPQWGLQRPDGGWDPALGQAWGARHRPDWHQRGLIIVPRGGGLQRLRLGHLRLGSMDGLEPCNAATHLYLQHNLLSEIESLEFFARLQFLVLSHNKLTHVTGIS